jgi:5-formyltetrahydrofolate cyclo-ligase
MRSDPQASAADALRQAKKAMRARVVAARNALSAQAHAADSRAIGDRVAALPSFRAARTVLLTLPFGSEWNVRPLAELALASGKRVTLPRVDATTRSLVLHAVDDLRAGIATGFRTIPEPRADTPLVDPEAIDWVLVPGVAFDDAGRRLGYGGGYYDRLLPRLRRGTPRVAGAFDVQIVPEVPAGPHDARVGSIITPYTMIVAADARP